VYTPEAGDPRGGSHALLEQAHSGLQYFFCRSIALSPQALILKTSPDRLDRVRACRCGFDLLEPM
jgi:hypothetical protein